MMRLLLIVIYDCWRCSPSWSSRSARTPSSAAAQEYPDFYGTVVAADRDLGIRRRFRSIRVTTCCVNVELPGRSPWNEGVFRLDNMMHPADAADRRRLHGD